MAKTAELLERAAKCRDLAGCAARLASTAYDDAERARLLRYCRDFEEQAAELEIEAAAFARLLTLAVGLEDPPSTPDPPTEGPADSEGKPKH
jgi:uncharacterized membrane protein